MASIIMCLTECADGVVNIGEASLISESGQDLRVLGPRCAGSGALSQAQFALHLYATTRGDPCYVAGGANSLQLATELIADSSLFIKPKMLALRDWVHPDYRDQVDRMCRLERLGSYQDLVQLLKRIRNLGVGVVDFK